MEGRVVNYRPIPADRNTPAPGLEPYMREKYADAMARNRARIDAVRQLTQEAVNSALMEAAPSPAPAPTAPRGGAPRRTMFENVVNPLLQGQGVPSYPYPAPMVPSMMGAIQQANDMNSQAMQLGDPTAALAIRGAQIRHSQGVSTVGDLLDVGEAVAEMTKKQRLGMHMEWLKRDARRHAMSQSGTQLI